MWFVAMTAAQEERKVSARFRECGHEPYLPLTRRTRVMKGRVVHEGEALFSRYVFVKACSYWRSIVSTRGVSRLLMDGDAPAFMRDNVVSSLRKLEDEEGFIVFKKEVNRERFEVGQKLRVLNGTYQDRVVIYAGMSKRHREIALMRLLGRDVQIEFGHSDLEVA